MDPALGIHEVERNQNLIAHITDENPSSPVLYPSPDDFDKAQSYKSSKYICIAPASVWFTKQWPVDKWITFIDQAPQDIRILLIGSSEDASLCEEIISRSQNNNIKSLAGKLNLMESAALMKNAVLNLVNEKIKRRYLD